MQGLEEKTTKNHTQEFVFEGSFEKKRDSTGGFSIENQVWKIAAKKTVGALFGRKFVVRWESICPIFFWDISKLEKQDFCHYHGPHLYKDSWYVFSFHFSKSWMKHPVFFGDHSPRNTKTKKLINTVTPCHSLPHPPPHNSEWCSRCPKVQRPRQHDEGIIFNV